MTLAKHLPNLFTSLNLFSGCLGIHAVTSGELWMAPYFVLAGAFFDFLDGFTARLVGSDSEIGKELDSLADLVTFGVLPAFVMLKMLQASDANMGWLAYSAFLIAIFSALRLAKFNVDTLQKDVFIGVPTPANAVFITGLTFWLNSDYAVILNNQYFLLFVVIVSSLIMVSPFRFIALKFKSKGWNGNQAKFVLLIGALLLIILFKELAASLIILWYILISMFENLLLSKRPQ
ncbi:MAG: CDP-diacylglycerol--serine O-phosphatidyltransferase [Cyclobacteriaceae bacterium]